MKNISRRDFLKGSVAAAAALSLTGISTAFAAEEAAASGSGLKEGLGYIAAALSTGISCLGGGIAVGNAAPAAIGATSEDPKAVGKALIFVALGEGVAIYGLLIAIMILSKV